MRRTAGDIESPRDRVPNRRHQLATAASEWPRTCKRRVARPPSPSPGAITQSARGALVPMSGVIVAVHQNLPRLAASATRGAAAEQASAMVGAMSEAPRSVLPRHGMEPDAAFQLVRDELMLDGNARLNLATFVTTLMEPQAEALMSAT